MRSRKRKLEITWREAWPIWLTFSILITAGLAGIRLLIPPAQIATKALAHGEDAMIAVGELKPNVPMMFTHRIESGQEADFLVERDRDDRLTAVFASCRRCYHAAHYLQGSHILCGRCRESMVRLASGQAPSTEMDCAHIPIPFQRSGNQVIVHAAAVDQAFARWFARPATSAGGAVRASE